MDCFHEGFSWSGESAAMQTAHTIVNVGYRSTNYWVVNAASSRILVDIGWPGSLGRMKANLKRMDVPIDELRFALATHYHMDHAGLAEEMKGEGVPLVVVDLQQEAIPLMKTWMKPADHYVEINTNNNITIGIEESRGFLESLDIAGEIFHTPGHSDHCVSLLLDDGSAFTGDLPLEKLCWDNRVALESWRLLRRYGATRVFPGHGPIYPLLEA